MLKMCHLSIIVDGPSIFKDYLSYHEIINITVQLFVFSMVLHGSVSNMAGELIILITTEQTIIV